jgi:HTH-type transcriptional regulator, competence development regulator
MAVVGKSMSLGDYLASQRKVKKLTLRQVEEATDKEVSNGYLSQLEHDRISKPSPNVLHKLADVYGISYEVLMEKAGYIKDVASRKVGERHGRIATFAKDDLTPEEEEALLQYLAFLRSTRKGESK